LLKVREYVAKTTVRDETMLPGHVEARAERPQLGSNLTENREMLESAISIFLSYIHA
jgi:hypothetical protein